MRTDQILMLLKTQGPMTAAAVAKELTITSEGARLQLTQLGQEGLVRTHKEVQGVGRPKQFYQLTSAGHARFPDTHADLTLQMITHIRDTLGPTALDRVIEAREAEVQQRYHQEMAGQETLEDRVHKLSEIRSREGYLAEVRQEEDTFLLIENHCPICEAATHCQGFCRSELNTFRQVLGKNVSVERTEHIVKGARRCAYRIKNQQSK
uniref:Transcriptional regulator n=1 Tax=Roseihalotalea indica TaxID=2867963 RepID=A0AA49JJD2_9BACT|nr:transcriptional regulator [Tunicatimonas sp. TK19036]